VYDADHHHRVPAKPSLSIRTHDIAPTYAKLRLDHGFCPCTVEPGDEFFANGIFEFNITRLLAFVHARPERFSVEAAELEHIPINSDVCHLDQSAVEAADVRRPVLLAEISRPSKRTKAMSATGTPSLERGPEQSAHGVSRSNAN